MSVLCLLQPTDLDKAQLGLGHSYSRAKVKFNVNRVDNMVIQAIFLLDTLDKDINSFSMRVRFVVLYFEAFISFIVYFESSLVQSVSVLVPCTCISLLHIDEIHIV